MSEANKLRKLIEEKYRNIKEFSEHADMPYTTVRSILERGVMNSSVDNVIKMCKALNMSCDELLHYLDTYTYTPPVTIAAHAEQDLTEEDQKKIREYIEFLQSQKK